ncbi:indolepyruvate/phenylpyruvate decarboxylase [Azospirillum sp. RWY-5-1]|uniref:Indolepyruvate/phenylpyruvate decarboxylase n=1 Tax=Azospirillum oleiclasticum TaxID=2735135 RepID=A0ABX2TFG5_9PROT|nr:indolepyruvate/phenylpyruvate decarboxylase [Azospirillum oleiclasticum]NYZ15667.1 indolepyruvate/phenylpyruvate decarboxylase [Azospirillum oleiclasticum]NYZ21937.1 indolepyruvate/phenylpyruvate decarboxylase [Azospirillum oleiclasticum]
MRLAEALLHALKERGAGAVFGIPGDFALPFFKVMEETRILPLHTLSHEPAVGFAADGAARIGSTLGVAAVTYGAGALNMVNPIAAAFVEKSPVVVVSGAPGRHEGASGLMIHHQGKTLDSQFRIYQEITCAQARLDDPATAPAEIARVLGACKAWSQPVYLELPRDMVSAEVSAVGADPVLAVDDAAVAAAAEEVLARLKAAKAPVLMVCAEVRRHGLESKVAELAQRLGVPVVTTFMGRGLLSAAPTPPLGTYLGVAGDPEITRLVEESDGLFMLGAILCDTNFSISKEKIDMRRSIHAADRRVTLGYHSYADIPLDRLVDALLARLPVSTRTGTNRGQEAPTGLNPDDGPIHPMDIARAVNDLARMSGPMPIASDIGDCLFTAMDMLDDGLMAPGVYAGMGFGVPAGMGAQAVTGRRMLIVVGDGAFQMTGWELGNCRKLGLDPIVVVFNNTSWEMLRTFQPESGFNDLDDWRFAEMAAAMGGDGVRVTTRGALRDALAKAHATRGRFQLIEAMIPRGVLSDTLARFVAGTKRTHTPQPGG